MQAWRLKMQTASFRGVEFQVTQAGDSFGRNSVTHVFPQADMPWNEDLGEAPRIISVSGFVAGSDYMSRRDALEAAFCKKGPGVLVHPWYGRVRVALEGQVTGTHSAQDGGMWSFTAQFVRVEQGAGLTGRASLLDAIKERAAAVMSAAARIADAILTGYATAWALAQTARDVARWVKAVCAVFGAGDDITPFAAMVNALPADDDGSWLAAELSAGRLGADMEDLMRTAAAAQGTLADAFNDGLTSAVGGVPAFLALAAQAPDPEQPAGPVGVSRAQVLESARDISVAWQAMAIALACEEAAAYVPETADAARQIQQDMVDAADRLVAACDEDLAAMTIDAAGAAARALAASSGTAPNVLTVTPAGTLPSLCAAWRWTGSLDAETAIIRRNRIRHPGFIPGGRQLEVLRSAAWNG